MIAPIVKVRIRAVLLRVAQSLPPLLFNNLQGGLNTEIIRDPSSL